MSSIDIVTVTHNAANMALAGRLQHALAQHADADYRYIEVSNAAPNPNVGFAKASNVGAARGDAPVIFFLNPDAVVHGPFMRTVIDALADPAVAIVGCDFGKPAWEVAHWGLTAWVCGAALGVRRDWFESVGGFDQRFVWSFEDSALARSAEQQQLAVRPLDLPISHTSPADDSPQDKAYKQRHFDEAAALYRTLWPTARVGAEEKRRRAQLAERTVR